MSLTAQTPQSSLEWQFQSSNVDSIVGLAPNLSTTGAYAAPTGGTITTSGGKRIHTFTSGTSSITFLVPVTAQVLVVAGGGGGGGGKDFSPGGGGGAGEVFYSASYSIAPGTYTVSVGVGGVGGVFNTGTNSTNGTSSTFGSITVNGGGRGGINGINSNGSDGGSGGGGARNSPGGASVLTGGGQGNAGGSSTGAAGAGGGGAVSAGANQTDGTTSAAGSAGGSGRSISISGSAVTYGAGADGGDRTNSTNGPAGTANRGNGGGGGGANATGSSSLGGNGGSGVVVVSYNAALYPAPTYVTGKYVQAINFNNTLSPSGADPNCYVTYDVSTLGLSANSGTVSLWLNPGVTYPVTAGTGPFYINLQGGSYNALYTPSASSNITCRIGSRTVDVGTWPGQTGVWDHHCITFSNVGAGASNTITSYYLNGSLLGNANNTIQSFTTLNLGCQSSISNGALCSIDDVRLFNTALTAAQVQAVYGAQGMPSQYSLNNVVGSVKTFMTGQPILSRVASGTSVGAFSLRAVSAPTARAVRVLRKSDNAQQDFWADRLGNLLTAPVTGQPLQTWLAGSAANVVTWYDQSGQGRHATGTQAIITQTSNVNQQWAINTTNGGLSLSGGAFLNGTNFTVACTTKRLGTQGNDGVYGYGANASWVSQASVPTTYGNNTRFALQMPNAGSSTVGFLDSSFSAAFSSAAGTLPTSFVAATEPVTYTTVTFTAATQQMYINGATSGTPSTSLNLLTANATPLAGFTIGTVNFYGNFLGEIGELVIFNSALSSSDVSTLYSAR